MNMKQRKKSSLSESTLAIIREFEETVLSHKQQEQLQKIKNTQTLGDLCTVFEEEITYHSRAIDICQKVIDQQNELKRMKYQTIIKSEELGLIRGKSSCNFYKELGDLIRSANPQEVDEIEKITDKFISDKVAEHLEAKKDKSEKKKLDKLLSAKKAKK